MVPLLTLAHPPEVAVPVVVLVTVLGDMRLLPEIRKLVNWRRVFSLVIPAMATIPFGVWLLGMIGPSMLGRIVSGVVLLLVGLMFVGVTFRGAERLRVLMPVGAASGILTGMAGVGGPPVVLALLSTDDSAAQTRANLIAFFTIGGIFALTTMLGSGTAEPEKVFPLFAVCAPPYLVAVHLGSKVFSRQEQRAYRKIALTFLAAVATFGLLAH